MHNPIGNGFSALKRKSAVCNRHLVELMEFAPLALGHMGVEGLHVNGHQPHGPCKPLPPRVYSDDKLHIVTFGCRPFFFYI